jgi:hypothetical protein
MTEWLKLTQLNPSFSIGLWGFMNWLKIHHRRHRIHQQWIPRPPRSMKLSVPEVGAGKRSASFLFAERCYVFRRRPTANLRGIVDLRGSWAALSFNVTAAKQRMISAPPLNHYQEACHARRVAQTCVRSDKCLEHGFLSRFWTCNYRDSRPTG